MEKIQTIYYKQELLNNLSEHFISDAIKFQHMIYNHYIDKNFIKIDEIHFYNNDTMYSKTSTIMHYKNNNVEYITIDIILSNKGNVSLTQYIYLNQD